MKYQNIVQLVRDRPEVGEFSVHRDIFRDPAVFDLEIRHIFEASWVFLGFACQAPNPNDYFTTWLGRHPIVIMRGANGELGAFLNSCRHRGALIAHKEAGNARYHVCRYHGWVYDSTGKNIDVKDEKDGCYPPSFAARDHNLLPLRRFAEYRGFLFGAMREDVPDLAEHLGETRAVLDLIVDQSEQGFELVPGRSSYIYKGNWKLQIENSNDLYHLSSTHPSFIKIVERRGSGESRHGLKALNFADYRKAEVVRGSYTFRYGHAMTWGSNIKPEIRPLYSDIERVQHRVGDVRARWMLASRNLNIFPNVQFAENASLQVRVIRPIAVDRTEMTIYCLGPVGESAQAREQRIRQYEDFFNSSGLATSDDTTVYEDCQSGYRAYQIDWQQGYERGTTAVRHGPDRHADELGISPVTSVSGGYDIQDETVFHAAYREWLRLMQRGFEAETVRSSSLSAQPSREAS